MDTITEREKLLERFHELPDRERAVVIHRLGLYGETPKNWREIGETIERSKARGWQIYQAACVKLRVGLGRECDEIEAPPELLRTLLS